MELREYLKIIKRKTKLILTVAMITGLSAFLFSVVQPIKYEISLSLFVNKDKTQETDDFKYDGYYALQAGEIITGSIAEWLKSPELVDAIYQEAGAERNFKDLKSYTKKFTVKKMSAQYVEVKFKTNSKEDAEKISVAVVKIVGSKVKTLGENSEQEISFLIENEKPIIIESKPDAFFNLIVGLVSGFVLGIFAVFVKEYFK
ncbi:MAG: Wzz/FepE/Etk N-terminal domain-containing protein [Patescibacteria group bacterium]|nr:Wzz/FepE/Etk N-terminal domain-containing protein [Patescibacteria group bacterium]